LGATARCRARTPGDVECRSTAWGTGRRLSRKHGESGSVRWTFGAEFRRPSTRHPKRRRPGVEYFRRWNAESERLSRDPGRRPHRRSRVPSGGGSWGGRVGRPAVSRPTLVDGIRQDAGHNGGLRRSGRQKITPRSGSASGMDAADRLGVFAGPTVKGFGLGGEAEKTRRPCPVWRTGAIAGSSESE